ncbi:MAG: integrase arm-type DNA-binding domain-containing protein [Piscirickettsiaceae bacterium]|nr:integrase arm-type DNA-binding domain-containing protein [Piscirickettsiaceae bacterium]
MALTDAWLKANSGRANNSLVEKNDRDGLSVRISPRGKLVFQVRYRFKRKAKRLKIGTYPSMTLKEARDEAVVMKGHLDQGYDPAVVFLARKIDASDQHSVEEVVREWYAKECTKDSKAHKQILRSYEIHVFPIIGKQAVKAMTSREWITIIEDVAKLRPQIASRLLTQTKKVYRWAYKRNYTINKPLEGLTASADFKIAKPKSNRTLSDDELVMVWKALRGCKMAEKNKMFIKLCLLFANRTSELRLSKREDFDFDEGLWTVPWQNHKLGEKTKMPIVRPIPKEFEVIIKHQMAISPSNVLMFVNRDKPNEVWPVGASVSLPYILNAWIFRHLEHKMKSWSLHDLRRTARTKFSAITERDVAEIMLAHSLPGVQGVYDLHKYVDEQRKAYTKWWYVLEEIVGKI